MWLRELFRRLYLSMGGRERPSPRDRVKSSQITYDKTNGVLKVQFAPNTGIKVFSVDKTKSMDGLMDIASNVIATGDFEHSKLKVGDIIIYQLYTSLVVHPILKIKQDIHGRLYQCRGINNVNADQHWVRDIQIKYVYLGQFD